MQSGRSSGRSDRRFSGSVFPPTPESDPKCFALAADSRPTRSSALSFIMGPPSTFGILGLVLENYWVVAQAAEAAKHLEQRG